ncbi:MAG: hypothetical protein AAGC55_17765 [Myxococcota bacterium]
MRWLVSPLFILSSVIGPVGVGCAQSARDSGAGPADKSADMNSSDQGPAAPATPGALGQISANSPSCRDAFAILDRRAWQEWTGLPGCTLAEVKAHYPQLSDGSGRSNLGADIVPAEFKSLPHPDYKKPIRVYYRGDRVVLLAVEFPQIADGGTELRASLGDPAAALDYYQRTVLYASSADIYPERGLAVLHNPSRSAVIRLYFFAPTTLDAYRAGLHHPVQAGRRLPARTP